MNVDSVIQFCELLLQFQSVERRIPLPGRPNENDAEHSYMLAMTGWYIADQAKLDLDISKVIKYGLVHDLVETYAGDTYAFDTGALKSTKAERERIALEIIRRNYPDFDELHQMIHDYEARADAESRFIYALDKIIPSIILLVTGTSFWADNNLSFDDHYTNRAGVVADEPIIADLWSQLSARLADQPELFPKIK